MLGNAVFAAGLLFSFGANYAAAASVDLALTQCTTEPNPGIRTGLVEIQLNYANISANAAAGAVITVPLPATSVYENGSASPNCLHDGNAPGVVTCTLPSVGADASGSVSFGLRTTAGTGTSISMSSSIATVPGDTDANAGNNNAMCSATINSGADLTAQVGGPVAVPAGGEVVWSVTGQNNGPNPAATQIFRTTLPGTLSFVSGAGAGWSCAAAAQEVTCSRNASVASGSSYPELSLTTRLNPAVTGGAATLTGAISSATGDPNTSNNVDEHTVIVNPGADLQITQALPIPDGVAPGGEITYQLEVTNAGPSAASDGLTVTFQLPAGFTPSGGMPQPSGAGWGACSWGGQILSCPHTGSFSVSRSETLVITAIAPDDPAPTVYGGPNDNLGRVIGGVNGPADPNLNNNTARREVLVARENAVFLTLEKTKSPSPVAVGAQMTSVLRVENTVGPYAAQAGSITLVDVLTDADESYVAHSGNWTCAAPAANTPEAGKTSISCTNTVAVPVGGSLELEVITLAERAGRLENEARVSHPGNWGPDLPVIGSVDATVLANSPDLQLTKTAQTPSGVIESGRTVVTTGDGFIDYTLVLTNLSAIDAVDIRLTDPIPAFRQGETTVQGAAANSPVVPVVNSNNGGNAAFGNCAVSADGMLTCMQTGGVLKEGETVTVAFRVNRALTAGDYVNEARAFSITQGDPNRTNNVATAPIRIQPLADLEMVAKTVSPESADAGTDVVYTLTFRNTGPDRSTNVVVVDDFVVGAGDPGFTFLSHTLQGVSGGSCTGLTAGASYTAGTHSLTCSGMTLDSGVQGTLLVRVRPNWQATTEGMATLLNYARVFSGSTPEQINGEVGPLASAGAACQLDGTGCARRGTTLNERSAELTVTQADLNVLIVTNDLAPAGPDPLPFDVANGGDSAGNDIHYLVRITNQGPSLATGLNFEYDMRPPEGRTMRFIGYRSAVLGSPMAGVTCDNINSEVTGVAAPSPGNGILTVSCDIDASLAAEAHHTGYMVFRALTSPEVGGYTVHTEARVFVNEPDTNPADNVWVENTTVRVRANLALEKVPTQAGAPKAEVQLREPFDWTIRLTNNGPGDSGVTQLVDTLPAGMEFHGATPSWSGSNPVVAGNTCGTTGQTLNCNFGRVNNGGVVTLTVPVRIVSGSGSSLQNCVSATTTEIDPDPSDNTNICANVGVERSSLSGRVYEDLNFNGQSDAGEPGIGNVALRLTGIDVYGNDVDLPATTNASGNYTFSNLSPANADGYTITQTQPAAYLDAFESAGTAGGAALNAGFDATPENNRITGIRLGENDAATGYNFGEVRAGTLEGWVFIDGNSNATRDAGEASGLPGLTVRIEGVDYTGATVVAQDIPTVASGYYQFSNLLPGTYTVTQIDEPGGMTYTGTQIGTVTGTASGVLGGGTVRPVESIQLASNGTGTNYNFGWNGQGLGGRVYVDLDRDGVNSGGDRPLAGVQITLSGTTSDNRNVCAVISPEPCTVTTDASGSYMFPALPASNGSGYTLTQQAQSVGVLRDYDAGPINVGTVNGGNVGVVGSNAITSVVIALGQSGSEYNFGHLAGELSGVVYHDQDRSGTHDGSDSGIPGVTLTLSGMTRDGQDVCSVVTCTIQTNADGSYTFPGLPASDGAGYTVVQTQPVDYSANVTTPGSAGGTAGASGNDQQITAIVLPPGEQTSGYLFGHVVGNLSGYVYHDHAADGTRHPDDDTGLESVTVVLSGLTASGVDVCTLVTCSVTTDANGRYEFQDLPNGSYTLTRGTVTDFQDKCSGPGTLPGGGSHVTTCATPGHDPLVIATVPFEAQAANVDVHTEYNFSVVRSASISGRVYLDLDGDEAFDASVDRPLEGVEVTLTGRDDQGNVVNVTVTTGPDGTYEFVDDGNGSPLRPSNAAGYTITETQPVGYGEFPSNGGQPGEINGMPVGTSPSSNVITGVRVPSQGGTGVEYNFRNQPSSLKGFVYLDTDDSGTKDAGEPGLSGVTVRLSGTDATGAQVSLDTVTDANGAFEFVGLRSGTYTLEEEHPLGYLDGRETVGTGLVGAAGTVDNTGFGPEPQYNRISAIELGLAEHGVDYLFGERGGFLNGHVYIDANDDGAMDGSEAGLSGVKVYITGTIEGGADFATSRGCAATPANCEVTTDANGYFQFDGVPPGNYQLRKAQEEINVLYNTGGSPDYRDGRETAGVVGGTVNNTHFGTQTAFNTISDIVVTSAAIAANNGNLGGYLFGVVPQTPAGGGLTVVPPVVSGYVYLDENHSRVRPSSPQADPRVAGWTVTLRGQNLATSQEEVICQVQTDEVGFYRFDNVECHQDFPQWIGGLPVSDGVSFGDFSIEFRGENGITTLPQSGGDAGEVDGRNARIVNLTLPPGADIVEQNLPLDPSGVVYDAVTRQPVPGAVVTLLNGGAMVPDACLVGSNPVTTGATGYYEFWIFGGGGCPGSGEYVLEVTSPPGYAPGPSTMIPAELVPLTPPLGGVFPVQPQNTAPAVGQDTTHYMVFQLQVTGDQATSSSNVVNNHIPLDPILGGAIRIVKTTPLVNVTKGQAVPYTIAATNTLAVPLHNIAVTDLIPAGFRYRTGSGSVAHNGTRTFVPEEPSVNGRTFAWSAQTFLPGETKTYRLVLMVGAGVGEGEYTNNAWAQNTLTSDRVSNIGQATVRIIPDPLFDCSEIIGTVFDDRNANGYQDQGEPGIPNARVVTARGLLVTTDAEGRFHVKCADIPNADRGSNFVMKLDERTLPSGYRVTSENPRDVRVTRGKMVKLNFGATIHTVYRIEVDGRAFVPGENTLQAEWANSLQQLIPALLEQPSVARLAYASDAEGERVAKQRLKALERELLRLYRDHERDKDKEDRKRPPLIVEHEVMGAVLSAEGVQQ